MTATTIKMFALLHMVFGENPGVNFADNAWTDEFAVLGDISYEPDINRVITGIQSTRPEENVKYLYAYQDEDACGPDGDDARWDWCDRNHYNCQHSVSTDECESGWADFVTSQGTGPVEWGPCCRSVYIDGCYYAYIATYKCRATNNGYLDRAWRFQTSAVAGLQCTALSWRGPVNTFEGALNWQCESNQALAAVEATYDNSVQDRTWRFKCCDITSGGRYRIANVVSTSYLNYAGEDLNLTCNRNEVVVGLESYFDQSSRDRRWLVKCGLVIKTEASSDLTWPQILTKHRDTLGESQEDSRCWKNWIVYDPLDGAGREPFTAEAPEDCQMECRTNDECSKWSFVWETQGWTCHLTTANAIEKEFSGSSKVGPKNGCYDHSTAVYKLATRTDCEYLGWDFIRNWDECMLAAKFFNVEDFSGNWVGGKQIWCSLNSAYTESNYNDLGSGSIDGVPLLTTATSTSYQICKTQGWANEHGAQFQFDLNGAPVMVDVGHSDTPEKTFNDAGVGSLKCPSTVSNVSTPACDAVRYDCCSYNTKYGMVPHMTWGTTPQDEMAWHTDNKCDEVMGGAELSNCPYTCETSCDSVRTKCCSYNSDYGMVPFMTWGTTPQDEMAWHIDNKCDEVMGGAELSNCPYYCGADAYVVTVDDGRDMTVENVNSEGWSKFLQHQCWQANNDIMLTGMSSRKAGAVYVGEFLTADERSNENAGCNTLTDANTCLSSRDGRPGQPWSNSPCRWCCGNACGTNNGNLCEPESWLLAQGQDKYIGYSANGLGDDTCPDTDRQFMFSTTQVPGVTCKALDWTDYQNSFGHMLDFTCPEGHAMAGFGSEFDGVNDRKFQFRCCDVRTNGWNVVESARNTGWSKYNDVHQQECQHNEVMIGLRAEYNSEYGDRRYSVRCGLLKNTFDDCLEINIVEMEVKDVLFEELLEKTADLQTMKASFDYCGVPQAPMEVKLETSGQESIEVDETIELEESLDHHFDFSDTLAVKLMVHAEITRSVRRLLRGRSWTVGMEFAVGDAMTGELGFNIGSSDTKSTTTSTETVEANSEESSFQPLPFEKHESVGSYGSQKVNVPVSMLAQCLRKDGTISEARMDGLYKTEGYTFITVKYEDKTRECPQSYYHKCECVPNMSSEFVGSGCTTHPVFDGAKGCYVYKGTEDSEAPTCTNGMALGTAEPQAGVAVDDINMDSGINPVNFGWSYQPCGGAQYYPGDANYKGVEFGDLVYKRRNWQCQWNDAGTLGDVPYSTRDSAITECYNVNLRKPNTCLGVYDPQCDNTGSFYLCSTEKELAKSGQGSCVWQMSTTDPDPENNPFDHVRRREELTAPRGMVNFEELWNEFGSDLREYWCEEYGCEDFDAKIHEL